MATADDRAVFERFLTVTRHHSPAAAALDDSRLQIE
jgi:hypothetical protein